LWSCALIGLFVLASVAVHIAQPRFDPFDVALSFYMNGAWGWFLRLGLIGLGAGSALLGVAIHTAAAGQTSRPSLILLRLWAAGCVVGGIFPPDSFGQWSRPPSPSGVAHSMAAMVAFGSFPFAALSLSRYRTLSGSRYGAALRGVAVVCAAMTLLLLLCLAPAYRHHPPYALGFVERIVLIGYVSWLLLASIAMSREG
jgi:hypothetical protein